MLQESVAGTMSPVETTVENTVVRTSSNVHESGRAVQDGLHVLTFEAHEAGDLLITIEVPLGDGVGFWNADSRFHRTVLLDWAGKQTTSLVFSVPAGCMYDSSGASLLSFALDEVVGEVEMRYGVWEWGDSYVVHLRLRGVDAGRSVSLALGEQGVTYLAALARIESWLGDGIDEELWAAPDFAREPLNCTWYSDGRRTDAERVARDARAGRELGIPVVLIDDGWQRNCEGLSYAGCGDWEPDETKFPDFAEFVRVLRDEGSRLILWVAPLLIGPECSRFSELLHLAPSLKESLGAHIVDPRIKEARAYLVDLCIALVQQYSLDGLKIDFLDDAMIYDGTPSTGDTDDVGVAMRAWLSSLRRGLTEAGLSHVLIEFRQPYVSPALAPYGNVIRAIDCPGDAISNRTSIIDSRLMSFGRVVHSDPIMWDPTADESVVARQILNAFFSVPQISMRLSELVEAHQRVVTFLLGEWQRVRSTVLDGELNTGLPVDHYPWVEARGASGARVLAVHQPIVVSLAVEEAGTLLLNATPEAEVAVRPANDVIGEAYAADGTLTGSVEIPGGRVTTVRIPAFGIARLRPAE